MKTRTFFSHISAVFVKFYADVRSNTPRIIYIFISDMGRVTAHRNTTDSISMKFQVRSSQIKDDSFLLSVFSASLKAGEFDRRLFC